MVRFVDTEGSVGIDRPDKGRPADRVPLVGIADHLVDTVPLVHHTVLIQHLVDLDAIAVVAASPGSSGTI